MKFRTYLYFFKHALVICVDNFIYQMYKIYANAAEKINHIA